jgi:hypothetical protein
MTTKDVISIFQEEFLPIVDRFVVSDMTLSDAEKSQESHVWKPGVYVFWHRSDNVVKVGRALDNSRKRAFEHIRDNTGGTMANLKNDPAARLILFNVKDLKDKHWVAAVEIFLEEALHPKIQSRRRG